jgi:ABC-type branched-subunit amino acid transport system substrate-binding protein
MREGILAAFEKSSRGRRNGRKLELKSIDDSYEPRNHRSHHQSYKGRQGLCSSRCVGTPTSKAGQPIATAAKVPFIGPFTGAEFCESVQPLCRQYSRLVFPGDGSLDRAFN